MRQKKFVGACKMHKHTYTQKYLRVIIYRVTVMCSPASFLFFLFHLVLYMFWPYTRQSRRKYTGKTGKLLEEQEKVVKSYQKVQQFRVKGNEGGLSIFFLAPKMRSWSENEKRYALRACRQMPVFFVCALHNIISLL